MALSKFCNTQVQNTSLQRVSEEPGSLKSSLTELGQVVRQIIEMLKQFLKKKAEKTGVKSIKPRQVSTNHIYITLSPQGIHYSHWRPGKYSHVT